MPKAFTFVHQPLMLRVEESSETPGWDITVQLMRLPACRTTVHQTDEISAKKTAIALAYGLCEQHKIDALSCLENPQWKLEE